MKVLTKSENKGTDWLFSFGDGKMFFLANSTNIEE